MTSINFDYIRNIPDIACRRAAVFLGLGVNAARDPDFNKYQLQNISAFKVVPDHVSEERLNVFKQSFEEWIISSALRELIESYAVFLDHIHQACLLMATSKNAVAPEDAMNWGPKFERTGLKDKLTLLRKRFCIKTEREVNLLSISKARNCIAHRRGVVGLEDIVDDQDAFILHWWRLELVVRANSGEEYSMNSPIPEGGIYLNEGGAVCANFSDSIKRYKLGEVIRLEANDLSEIIFLVQWSSREILKDFIEHAKKLGIVIKNKHGDAVI